MRAVVVAAAIVLLCSPTSAAEFGYIRFGEPGRVRCATAPSDWQRPEVDDSDWSRADAARDGGIGCAGTRYERWRFGIGAELTTLRTLTLRIRYAHGFAAYVNGVEVARQRLAPDADAASTATDWHDLEAERISIPVRPDLLRGTGNVLAVEVHPRTAGKQPTVDVELAGSEAARMVRGPYLEQLSEREVTVVLDTDLPTTAIVRWGRNDTYGSIVRDDEPRVHHALRIVGLRAGTAYHYRVEANETEGARTSIDAGDASFHTPPRSGGILRFIAYGDTRTGHDVHAQLNRQMAAEDPDFAVVTGDLVGRGTDDGDWERFFEIASSFLRQVTIFPAPGNHDYGLMGRGLATLGGFFRTPFQPFDPSYFSFTISGVHFVALDSNQYRSPVQRDWFEKDLSKPEARKARAIFVYAHEPPYTTGMHGNNEIAIRDYVPIMVRHHVSMFFGGHDHHYERGRIGGFDYIITGGGGAELRATKCGMEGTPPCPPSVFAVAKEYHYVLVEVLPKSFRVCPKRLDGSALEACTTLPLRR